MNLTDLQTLVNQLSQQAEFLFITNKAQDFYESFWSQWANFTNVMPT
jgi:hypothetical protein